MTGKWKPGDVALVTSWRGANQIAFRCERVEGEPRWCVLDGGDTRGLSDDEVSRSRPVAVIDPDSREQIERLAAAFLGEGGGPLTPLRTVTDIADALQAALTEYANPTPPKCDSALIVKGEHFVCDQTAGHAMTHSNINAGALWGVSL